MNTAPNVRVIEAKPRAELEQNPYRRLRVAAYCRVSTVQEEQQNSYQVQIEYYSEYIRSNKQWQLAGIFADEGISGTSTEKRTAFNRMIRMCKQKKIDLILCKSASRFARNTVDCLKFVRLLKGLGIGVIFEKENINTLTESSEFILALHSSFAQAESESISKNAVGEISWNHNTIRSILTNEKYTGDALLQKTYTVDCISHRQKKNNGEKAKFLVTDAHPAIIDRDTFNLVQQEMTRRTSKRKVSTVAITEQGKYSGKFALTELLICGECGTPYRRCSWNIRGKKRKVWRCLSRLENGTKYCHQSPTLDEEKLQQTIVRTINAYFDCGDETADILRRNMAAVLGGKSGMEIRMLETKLADIDRSRSECIEAITSGAVSEDALDEQFQQLYEEEERLTKRLEALKAEHLDDDNARLESALAGIESTQFRLERYDDILVRKLIECIRVLDSERIQIIFKGGAEVMAELEA